VNNSRPALHASRIFALPDERDHRKQDIPQYPDPAERLSPLARPLGESGEGALRDCRTCAVRPQCRPDKFALEVCEMQISKRSYTRADSASRIAERRLTQAQTILAELRSRGTFTVQDIVLATGLHYTTVKGHIVHLVDQGAIRHVRREGKAIIYEPAVKS